MFINSTKATVGISIRKRQTLFSLLLNSTQRTLHIKSGHSHGGQALCSFLRFFYSTWLEKRISNCKNQSGQWKRRHFFFPKVSSAVLLQHTWMETWPCNVKRFLNVNKDVRLLHSLRNLCCLRLFSFALIAKRWELVTRGPTGSTVYCILVTSVHWNT